MAGKSIFIAKSSLFEQNTEGVLFNDAQLIFELWAGFYPLERIKYKGSSAATGTYVPLSATNLFKNKFVIASTVVRVAFRGVAADPI